jgi:hypothetical protein
VVRAVEDQNGAKWGASRPGLLRASQRPFRRGFFVADLLAAGFVATDFFGADVAGRFGAFFHRGTSPSRRGHCGGECGVGLGELACSMWTTSPGPSSSVGARPVPLARGNRHCANASIAGASSRFAAKPFLRMTWRKTVNRSCAS